MTHDNELAIVRAIATLEAKLTTAMSLGLQQIQAQLSSLNEAHHRALLEQERRNASFASLQQLDHLQAQLASLERRTAATTSSLLSGLSGHLLFLLISLACVLLTFLLAHAVH